MNIAEMAYRLTKKFPYEERYNMVSQIKRSADSIPANIAEGWGRKMSKEFIHYLRIASGSLRELETHLLLSERCDMVCLTDIKPILTETEILSKQIWSLQYQLQTRNNKVTK
ncbi:MAG: four helix bundle protein [Candidatus Cloacimonas sp.]|nr:four helix bundle protein [Candidatus Cloacimonas sp.]